MRIISQFWVEGMILNALGSFPDLYRDRSIPTLKSLAGGICLKQTFCRLQLLWEGEVASDAPTLSLQSARDFHGLRFWQ